MALARRITARAAGSTRHIHSRRGSWYPIARIGSGFHLRRSTGGCVGWLALPRREDERIGGRRLAQFAANGEAQIFGERLRGRVAVGTLARMRRITASTSPGSAGFQVADRRDRGADMLKDHLHRRVGLIGLFAREHFKHDDAERIQIAAVIDL